MPIIIGMFSYGRHCELYGANSFRATEREYAFFAAEISAYLLCALRRLILFNELAIANTHRMSRISR